MAMMQWAAWLVFASVAVWGLVVYLTNENDWTMTECSFEPAIGPLTKAQASWVRRSEEKRRKR
jgi:hypothetical protein